MEARLEHPPVIHRIDRGMWEDKAGVLHVLVRVRDARTTKIKTCKQEHIMRFHVIDNKSKRGFQKAGYRQEDHSDCMGWSAATAGT